MSKDVKKILVLGAHDDDMVIGVGGILMLRHTYDEIFYQVFTNGQNSHVVVLNEHNNPTTKQVQKARKRELEYSNKILSDHSSFRLDCNQWKYPDTCGVLTKNKDEVQELLTKLFDAKQPDIVYFHAQDAHEDHRLVNEVTSEVLQNVKFKGDAYEFSIWTKEVAMDNPEIDDTLVPALKENSEVVDISSVLSAKRKALFAFKSQIETQPYKEWKSQSRAILNNNFIEFVLRGEEIITPWK